MEKLKWPLGLFFVFLVVGSGGYYFYQHQAEKKAELVRDCRTAGNQLAESKRILTVLDKIEDFNFKKAKKAITFESVEFSGLMLVNSFFGKPANVVENNTTCSYQFEGKPSPEVVGLTLMPDSLLDPANKDLNPMAVPGQISDIIRQGLGLANADTGCVADDQEAKKNQMTAAKITTLIIPQGEDLKVKTDAIVPGDFFFSGRTALGASVKPNYFIYWYFPVKAAKQLGFYYLSSNDLSVRDQMALNILEKKQSGGVLNSDFQKCTKKLLKE